MGTHPFEFVTVTPQNVDTESLCCIVRKKAHPGVEAKRAWLRDRLPEGHIFRKIPGDGCAFIEYAPLSTAWVPILGDRYLYIYCLWIDGAMKKHGYGSALMESCIHDAKEAGWAGICMLGCDKQKAWLADQSFTAHFGFRPVEETPGGYRLFARSLDGTLPRFTENAMQMTISAPELTVYYSLQCPFIPARIDTLRQYCADKGIPARFLPVDSLERAKSLPCVFNNWAVFYHGQFVTVNQIAPSFLERLLRSHL